MINVKVIGAGSIGNHLTQAARRMGWNVVVVDNDPDALNRMKNDIYPSRYGKWDSEIELYDSTNEPQGNFDLICIGTPPDVRMDIAMSVLQEKPQIILLEKPLCTPSLEGLNRFLSEYDSQDDTVALVGYNYGVAESTSFVVSLLDSNSIGSIQIIDVEFREHWQGILDAHPWLNGPEDSYLGYFEKGGGAGCEHSHALHLWQIFANHGGLGKWKQVDCCMEMNSRGMAFYDSIAAFQFVTDQGKLGRVVQDVITLPVKKRAFIQGEHGYIEWLCNGHVEGDIVCFDTLEDGPNEKIFRKNRQDEFYWEMLHINDIMEKRISSSASPISLESGVAVMKVLSSAYNNRNNGKTIPEFNLNDEK